MPLHTSVHYTALFAQNNNKIKKILIKFDEKDMENFLDALNNVQRNDEDDLRILTKTGNTKVFRNAVNSGESFDVDVATNTKQGVLQRTDNISLNDLKIILDEIEGDTKANINTKKTLRFAQHNETTEIPPATLEGSSEYIYDVLQYILSQKVNEAIVMNTNQFWKVYDEKKKNIRNSRAEYVTSIEEKCKINIMTAIKLITKLKKKLTQDEWEVVWDSLLKYQNDHETSVLQAIYDSLHTTEAGYIDLFVCILMKAIYPSFQFNCKNNCSVNNDIQCEKMRELVKSVATTDKDAFLQKFDQHFFFAFRCSILGKKYKIADLTGGKKKTTYKTIKGKRYKVHIGTRGGKYIVKDAKKCYF